ncbi:MAG: hypothetical protein K1X79_02670 [Oligoflexia bacterium]|nr:hypothetical protein [Oligoflexia bacterium]
MARKSDYNRYILSAGEIGAYTVCPESWRLSAIEKVRTTHDQSSTRGMALHKSWAQGYEEAVYFGRAARALLLLMLLCIAIYILL